MIVDWIVVLVVALLASGLTLFSGFGLGTLLLPAFALVLPLPTAVAATAVVHLANNLWKVVLVGRGADRAVVLRFGVPAMAAAFLGAWLLGALEGGSWRIGPLAGTWIATTIGLLIIAFALFDLLPRLRTWHVGARWLSAGGLLSGFFGGLSGHQGALRGAFLTKVLTAPKVYVSTGVWCAILVDVSRLVVYGPGVFQLNGSYALVGAACVAAFLGAVLGKRALGKVTMERVRTLVGVLMMLTGGLLALGLI